MHGTTRAAAIYERLTEAVAGTALPVPVPASSWPVGDPDRLHTPFGITVPGPRESDGRVVFHYSKDIIQAQTLELSDHDFDCYLDALEVHVTLHLVHLDRPLDDVERMYDKTLGDIAPSTLTLMNAVQMRVLDG